MSRARRLAGAVTAAAVCSVCLSTPPSVTAVTSPPEWTNPLARPTDDGDVTVDVVSAPDAVGEGEAMRVVLAVFNDGDEPLTDLVVSTRRGATTWNVPDARRALALGAEDYPFPGPVEQLRGDLAPGERREITVTLPAEFLPTGTHPVMFAAGGTTERLLVTVTGQDQPAEPEAPAEQTPDLTMLLPVTAPLDIVPGETGQAPEMTPLILQSELLAGQLAPGGRLSELLDIYAREKRGTCLAVDPALVDTAARMAEGYTVAGSRPSLTQKRQRLRDSWFSDDDPEPGVPGRGAADAERWLKTLAEAHCIVALPWATADLDAVARTEDEWLFREAVQRGTAVLEDTLGVTPVPNVIIPPSGYVTEQTAPSLGWADSTTPLEIAWEAAAADRATRPETTDSALESTIIPDRTGAPVPQNPVRTLIADNSVWGVPVIDQAARLAPGVVGITYPADLASLLAATGPAPQTTGFSNPDWRLDYRLDSVAARAVTAGSAVRLAVESQTLPGDWAQTPEPVLVVPAPLLDAATATTLIATVGELLDTEAAQPRPLAEALTVPAELELQPLSPPTEGVVRFGSPWEDPARISDSVVLRAAQQARYTDDLTRMMVNDPAINLTRYQFTLPPRRDVLMSLTGASRSSLATHDAAVAAADRRLDGNRQTLQNLRGSVALIPPGNVYTRASESSPLLIVAENGLPLPVDADLTYAGPADATIDAPGPVHIPAHGSITVQLTADLPPEEDQTRMTLWLATRDGSPISAPVEITVQTRAGIVGTYGIALLIVVGLSLALLFRVGRHRRHRQREQHEPRHPEQK